MKIVGIIAEYNPFHQGHAYHLAESRKITQADYVIVVMSGNYVQRGIPAMFDKYTRAEAALKQGADLILELPLSAATGSAEYFASGAVSLLQHTGIVTDLCFGSECGNLTLLQRPADVLSEEPPEYQQFLRDYLKKGEPYPKARALALHSYDASIPLELLNEPNNLLALEYLKALGKYNCTIQPHTICRKGNHYHDIQLTEGIPASASGIRTALIEKKGTFTDELQKQLPFYHLFENYSGKTPITEDAFSLLLLEKLRRIQHEPLTVYFDVNEELSNRIWNCIDDFTSFSQFTDRLKTKNLTRTAVSRALLHILLDIRAYEEPSMFRVLGFRKHSAQLLKMLTEKGSLPVVTSLTNSNLPEKAFYADRLYESVRSLLHEQPYQNEYRRKMLVIQEDLS